jgi:hypothetical protein
MHHFHCPIDLGLIDQAFARVESPVLASSDSEEPAAQMSSEPGIEPEVRRPGLPAQQLAQLYL